MNFETLVQVVTIRLYLQNLFTICYSQPFPREIWHYKQANTEFIRRAITDFNWDRAFLNTNVNILSNSFLMRQ